MERIQVGRIGKPFGIKGDVYVRPDADIGTVIVDGATFETSDGREVTVTNARWHGDRFLVSIAGCDDRNAAETFRNQDLWADRSTIEVDDDWFWADELIGLPVVDTDTNVVGHILGIREGAAHDWIVVGTDTDREHLIPNVETIIDLNARPIVIDPPEGLLELE